jgi:hypothetical protein
MADQGLATDVRSQTDDAYLGDDAMKVSVVRLAYAGSSFVLGAAP